MTENAVEKFDPQKLAGKLRERMRDSIADLMSAEDWDKLVRAELNTFFVPKRGSYGHQEPSVFTTILREEFEAEARARIKDCMAKDATWQATAFTTLPEKLDRMVAENLPAIVKAIIEGAVEGLGGGVQSAIEYAIERKTREL